MQNLNHVNHKFHQNAAVVYDGWKLQSVTVSGHRLHRIYKYLQQVWPQFIDDDLFIFDALTTDIAIEIIDGLPAINNDVKKQLVTEFTKLLKVYEQHDIYGDVNYIFKHEHIIFLSNLERSTKTINNKCTNHKTWSEINAISLNIISKSLDISSPSAYNGCVNSKILASMLYHLPPMRVQDYTSASFDETAPNYIDLQKHVYIIREFKTKDAFAQKYGNNGARIIDLPVELCIEIDKYRHYVPRKWLFINKAATQYANTSFSNFVKRIYGDNMRTIRILYATFNIDGKTGVDLGRIAYIMGHNIQTHMTDYVVDDDE